MDGLSDIFMYKNKSKGEHNCIHGVDDEYCDKYIEDTFGYLEDINLPVMTKYN